MTKVFICTDINALKNLGFKYSGTEWLYRTNGHYRIVIENTGIIRFINHSIDSYSMFKKMVELGIVEETDMTIHYNKKPKTVTKINTYSIKDINHD